MSSIAILLILASAFLHAGWNLAGKRRHPSAAFFMATSLAGALLFLPLLALDGGTLFRETPARVWAFWVMTGFFMALYYACLAGAYRSGDMSVAYPLARSSPVIVVTVVAFVLGRGDQVSSRCILGILLVMGGCFLVPMRRFSDLRPGNYLNATCILALLAAVGTAGYSIIDDEALRVLRNSPAREIGNTRLTLVYAGMEFLSASLWLAAWVALRPRERMSMRLVLLAGKRHAVLTGVAISVTYVLVLSALAFVDNVTYVVGFRQLSIPLGAVLAILFLGEPPHAPKLVGVVVMFAGLVLVAVG